MSGARVDSQDLELREGFEAFIAAARRLEESHAALRARADAVDVQLADTNRRLARTLQEREAVFAALPVGVIAVDACGEVAWSNPEGARLLAAAARAGLALPRARSGDARSDMLAVRVRRIDLPGNGVLVLVEDRSQLARLEREIDRLDRLAGLSELALGVAHEIKNPLNGAMGFATLLQRSHDSAEMRRFAARIHAGLEQVDAIVRAMLAFARPTKQMARPASLQEVLRAAASAAGVPLGRIHQSGDVGAPVVSFALVTVLANLVRNSADAAGVDVEIRMHAECRGGDLVLLVSDDGPGVAASDRESVFEPFFSSKEGGHGLGLAVASRVIGYLGGTLELLNPGERGARFRVRVPLLGPAARCEGRAGA